MTQNLWHAGLRRADGDVTENDMGDPMQSKKPLRSQAWFGRQDKMGFYYRSFLKNQGTPQDQFEGRPVIGICNTWSELTPCNAHFRKIAEHVKKGVLEAGGFPVEFPVFPLFPMIKPALTFSPTL